MKSYIHICIMALFFIYGKKAAKFLPTLSDEEYLRYIECFSESKNKAICMKFNECNNKLTDKVKEAYNACRKSLSRLMNLKCASHTFLFPSTKIPAYIFACIKKKITKELKPKENEQMKEFENCFKELYKECEALKKN